jgi:hypothetical protein
MLRTALQSVATQTARDHISKVIVSENTGYRNAERVAVEFADLLPIQYQSQQEPLTPLQHDRLLSSQIPDDGYVAILHDDDWWERDHLASSLERLKAVPEAVASYAGYFRVQGEASLLECDSNLMFWFGLDYPKFSNVWKLDRSAVWMGCLWGTPGVFSTLVARVSAYRSAADVYLEGNPFDVDRLLTLRLAEIGPVVFGPQPRMFMRLHSAQGGRRFSAAEQERHYRSTTRKIVTEAMSTRFNLRGELSRRIDSCPVAAKALVCGALASPWCLDTLMEFGQAPEQLVYLQQKHRNRLMTIISRRLLLHTLAKNVFSLVKYLRSMCTTQSIR